MVGKLVIRNHQENNTVWGPSILAHSLGSRVLNTQAPAAALFALGQPVHEVRGLWRGSSLAADPPNAAVQRGRCTPRFVLLVGLLEKTERRRDGCAL